MAGYLEATVYGPTYYGSLPAGSGTALGSEMILSGADAPYTGVTRIRRVQYNASGTGNLPNFCPLKFVGQNIVDVSVTAGDNVIGSNDIAGDNQVYGTGASIAPGSFLWISVGGLSKILLNASIAIGTTVCSSTTANPGKLIAYNNALTTMQQTNIVALAASGGSGGATLCNIS